MTYGGNMSFSLAAIIIALLYIVLIPVLLSIESIKETPLFDFLLRFYLFSAMGSTISFLIFGSLFCFSYLINTFNL